MCLHKRDETFSVLVERNRNANEQIRQRRSRLQNLSSNESRKKSSMASPREEKRGEDGKDRKARRLEEWRWEEWGGEESQHLETARHHSTLMVNLFSCRRGKKEGNLFPVIFHLVSLCSDILHLLHQLFAACADRWLLLFDMHSPLAHSPSPPYPLTQTFRGKANLGYGLRWILLSAEKASWLRWETDGHLQNTMVYNKQTFPQCPGGKQWSRHYAFECGSGSTCVSVYVDLFCRAGQVRQILSQASLRGRLLKKA